MPEMNGHEVALEMRQLRPEAPIIMVSGAVDVPEQVLKSVDAFVGTCDLARELLPAISHFLEC
jgi:FixJ family two-component response regulator